MPNATTYAPDITSYYYHIQYGCTVSCVSYLPLWRCVGLMQSVSSVSLRDRTNEVTSDLSDLDI